MRTLWLAGAAALVAAPVRAQAPDRPAPVLNVRLSGLLFPFTPLLTLEVRTVGRLTVQGETNFGHIHGLNAKWFLREPLNGGYVFAGSAWVRHALLRQDGRAVVLPYTGYGHAWALDSRWVLDARAGLGPAVNADRVRVYPVLKVGAGRTF